MMSETTTMVKYERALTMSVGTLANTKTLLDAYRQSLEDRIPKWSPTSWKQIRATAIGQVAENHSLL